MKITFQKYQGAGNDFVMLDNFSGQYDELSISAIQQLCDRRFGIGGDGLIKINRSAEFDFEVDYYNSDGSKSFCGNGARCSVAFVHENILTDKKSYTFSAIDGVHTGEYSTEHVTIDMRDVAQIEVHGDLCFELNTGSPHYIQFDKMIDEKNIVELGREIRYSERYKEQGINVNWVESDGTDGLKIRTYERGVENETLACGTGVTAAALAFHHRFYTEHKNMYVPVKAKGGDLAVKFSFHPKTGYSNIYLIGPAEYVFKGEAEIV